MICKLIYIEYLKVWLTDYIFNSLLRFSFVFLDCGLRVVGSSVNGLGTNSSDADMCLVLSAREVFYFTFLILFFYRDVTFSQISGFFFQSKISSK